MSYLLKSQDVTIGGRTFTLRLLNVTEGRKVLGLIQRFLPAWSTEAVLDGLGPVATVGLSGALSDSDLGELCDVFGPATVVQLGEAKVSLGGKDSKTMSEVFAGAYEDMFAWLDACVSYNFKGFIEKLKGALLKPEATAPKKTE